MDTSRTLAEALLNDLDDLDDIDEDADYSQQSSGTPEEDKNDCPNIRNELQLLESTELTEHLSRVRKFAVIKSRNNELLIQSNKYLALLSDEMAHVHSILCEAYKSRFPELEAILRDPTQYMKAVAAIRNETDLTLVTDQLNKFLTNQQVLTISVAGSATKGRTLSDSEMTQVDMMLSYLNGILSVQEELQLYIRDQMIGLAPSTCALLGSTTAARLVGAAGGLAELAKIPACNLQTLGLSVSVKEGTKNSSPKSLQGILVDCDIVKAAPSSFQARVAKTVAAKLALAVRCDFVNLSSGKPPSEKAGLQFRAQILAKLDQWQTPDTAPTQKALPKPDLTTKKRRGGRRIRKMKERFEETAMMKQANTRAFSTQTGEYGDDAMGLTRGLMDSKPTSSSSSRIRKTVGNRVSRIVNTKASRKRALEQERRTKNSTSGLSSMVFSPAQGIELANPDAKKKRVEEANLKWFNTKGFCSSMKDA